MQGHLCSERWVFGCSWELSQNDLYCTLPCHRWLFSQLPHKAPGKHLHLSTNVFETFFNSSFLSYFPPIDLFQVSKQQDCFGGNVQILSHKCSSQSSAAGVFCKLYTAFMWDQSVVLAVGLNLCLAVYVGWCTISDISVFRTVLARLCRLQLLTEPTVQFMVVYCLYLFHFRIKLWRDDILLL